MNVLDAQLLAVLQPSFQRTRLRGYSISSTSTDGSTNPQLAGVTGWLLVKLMCLTKGTAQSGKKCRASRTPGTSNAVHYPWFEPRLRLFLFLLADHMVNGYAIWI